MKRERRPGDQPADRHPQPAAEWAACRLERAVRVEVGQEARDAPGEHGLARPRWADQEEVVAPGRRDLGRSNRRPLTADIGEVGVEERVEEARCWRIRPRALAVEGSDDLLRHRADHPQVRPTGGLLGARRRDHDLGAPGGIDQRHDARDTPQRAVQPELADECPIVDRLAGQLSAAAR